MIQEIEPEQKIKKGFKFRRGFKSWAEKVSIDYRDKLGIKHYQPICAFELAEHFGVDVITPENVKGMEDTQSLLNDGVWSALLMKDNENKHLIIHNGAHSEKRQQSNVMHELSHFICMHPMKERNEFQNLPILRSYNEEQEQEAFWLGGCLQLPRSSLVWSIRKKMSVEDISEFFKASTQMVTFRLNITGVKKQMKINDI